MLRLTIDTSNAAFKRDSVDHNGFTTGSEELDTDAVARYLETLASILRSGMQPPTVIIDCNGNTVGKLEIR